MRGFVWRRLGASVFAVWFLLSSVDGGLLHACAMHASAGARSSASTPESHGASGAADVSHHAHEASAGAQALPSSPSDTPTSEPHRCACLGPCGLAAGAVLARVEPQRAVEIEVRTRMARVADRHWYPAPFAFRQPPATAPPIG